MIAFDDWWLQLMQTIYANIQYFSIISQFVSVPNVFKN